MSTILVVGSINMDLITVLVRFPKVGETVLGSDFITALGGKGANQAVAAARLGSRVSILGAVGDDAHGQAAIQGLQQEGVDVTGVVVKPACATGIASITVAEGDNHIIVVPGANFALTTADIQAHEALFAAADVVLCQLEIPLPCVLCAAQLARQYGAVMMLNPAPAQPLSADTLSWVDVLTPNQIEWRQLWPWADNAGEGEAVLHRLPALHLVVTEGAQGVSYYHANTQQHWPAFAVPVVDTTGAGDTFNAALAVYWSQGIDVAVRHAQAAAALAVQGLGAQTAMPTASAVLDFLDQA